MPTIVKTKQNIVTLSINQQLSLLRDGGDIEFLRRFVRYCHRNAAQCQINAAGIIVKVRKQQFFYYIYRDYIRMVNESTLAYCFFKIT